MLTTAAHLLLATAFATYPGLGDRAPVVPKEARSPRIEATIDKGLMIEMIVACRPGSAILTYSKVERVYCTPRHGCGRSLQGAISRACGA